METEGNTEVLAGQQCPMCKSNKATLAQHERTIPFGDKEVGVFIYSLTCEDCKYHVSDLEFAQQFPPVKYTLEVDSEKDMSIRIVKSAEAVVKIPHIITIESGPQSHGYITNVEGLLKRVKHIIEQARDSSEDKAEQKKAKNMLKKLQKVMWGQEKLKIVIEDKTGNSAIISEKAVKSKL